MKRTFFKSFAFAICIGFATISFAENIAENEEVQKKEPPTKVERFFSKKGSMFIKNFYDAGTINGHYSGRMEVQAIVGSDLSDETKKIRGLKIEIINTGRIDRTHSSFLDIEEVESFIKAIGYLQAKSEIFAKEVYKDYRELTFSTRDDFNFGVYQKGNTAAESEIVVYASSGVINKTNMFMGAETLKEVKQIIEKGYDLAKTK